MRAMSDRKIQTNNIEQVKPFDSNLNSIRVFILTLTVAIFCKSSYWKCHMAMGIVSLGKRS